MPCKLQKFDPGEVCVYICMYMCVFVCVSKYMHACMYMYMYVCSCDRVSCPALYAYEVRAVCLCLCLMYGCCVVMFDVCCMI